jgi:glutamine amidotransferase
MSKKIIIVDYGRGNLRSVAKALEKVGAKAEVSSSPNALRDAWGVVLPGVGAFGDAMSALRRLKLVAPMRQAVRSGKPVLGICLGLQLFFEKGMEYGAHRGFGFFKGAVRRFQGGLKVPHMGWNQVRHLAACPLFAGIRQEERFYFVHSYRAQPEDPSCVSGWTDYGPRPFASAVWRENLYATQFHPEKSQAVGLKLYQNFIHLVKRA